MRRRQWAQGTGSALLGGLLGSLALPALAQNDGGEFTILHARYGTERNHIDVTSRLRELARRDDRLRLSNELFGADPDHGHTKTLRIFTRDRRGRERTMEFREGDWIDGSQFVGWGGGGWGDGGWQGGWNGDRPGNGYGPGRDAGQFTILYATYGTQRREVDVTDRLRELARRDRRFQLGNNQFGVDPDPGRTKLLRIVARDRRGAERSFDYREGAWVDGGQFIGWSGGDWGPSRPAPNGLLIESASYGADGRWVDVTRVLREQVRGDRFDAEVSNDLLGLDPAPNRRKLLRVRFRAGRGPVRTVEVAEGDRIRLP